MYSTHNEGKSVVAKNLLEPQRITYISIRLHVHIDRLDDIVNKYS